MPFLYGNHVLKAHLGRITEDMPEHQCVVVYSMDDVPLVIGFVFHCSLSSSILVRSGIRCHVQINSGYPENGPYSHRRFSSSVRSCKYLLPPLRSSPSCPRDVGEYLRDEVNQISRGHRPPLTYIIYRIHCSDFSPYTATCALLHYYYVIEFGGAHEEPCCTLGVLYTLLLLYE